MAVALLASAAPTAPVVGRCRPAAPPCRPAAAAAAPATQERLPAAAVCSLFGTAAASWHRRWRRRRRWPRVAAVLTARAAEAAGQVPAPLASLRAAGASKIVVALDIDEVLAQYLDRYLAFRNGKYKTSFQSSDFFEYTFWKVFGDRYEEEQDYVSEFHATDYFKSLELVPGAQEGVRRLASLPSVELHIVTSRQEEIAEETRSWLERHFPGIFPLERIHIGNHFGRTGPRVSKSKICVEIGARLLIDDSWEYCREVAEAGTPALLFDLDGSYAWNKGDDRVHGLVTRVTSWTHVVDLLSAALPEPLE
uniref:5'-nucleotidase n=1 Tax=Alexandrium monilatum TaxID=311494 RepID=A0A7S4PWU5_9DINO